MRPSQMRKIVLAVMFTNVDALTLLAAQPLPAAKWLREAAAGAFEPKEWEEFEANGVQCETRNADALNM